MKLTATDWHALRNPILTLVAVILLGIALVFFSHQELAQTKALLKNQEIALHEAQERLHKSGEERDKILRYRAEFIALQQHGFIGEEQRINWVDALRVASLSLKMFGINYQIEAQQLYAASVAPEAGPYRLRQSVMKINMGLLHEEDVLRFVNALAEQQAGVFSIRECSLQRQGTAKAENVRVQPNLLADCSLAWLTISEVNAREKP